MVIDLYYGVVGADGVGQSIVDGGGPVRIGAVVRGKALAIAGNRRAQGAAADLQTHRTDGNAFALHVGEGVDDAGGRITGGIVGARQRDGQRRGERAGVADRVALPFVGSKEEHSILDDGAADAGPKLLEISRVLCLRRRIEVVAGVERCVAAESIGSSVHAVGPRLQAYVDNGSRFPAVLCGRILLEVELLDRIDRQDRGRVSGNAGTIDDALSGEGLAVEEAVDEVGVIFGAQAVAAGGGKSTARIANYTGAQLEKVFIVASV